MAQSDLDALEEMGVDTSSRRFGKPYVPPTPTPTPPPPKVGQSNLLRQFQMLMAGRQPNPIVNPTVPAVVPPAQRYQPVWPLT